MSSKDKMPLTLMKIETELRADFAPTAKLQKDRLSTDNPFATFKGFLASRTVLHEIFTTDPRFEQRCLDSETRKGVDRA